MILARNHRQPSNGNRLSQFLLFFCCLLIASCGSSRQVADEDDDNVVPIVVVDPSEDTDTSDTVDPVVIVDPVEPDEPEDIPEKKYTIALLLPFNLDQYEIEFMDVETTSVNRSTSMALEFFQGFDFAVAEMDQYDVEAEIHVFDTQNSVSTTERILKSPSFPDVDLIIGPVYNNNLKVASKYCKRNEIPMISPLSSSHGITSDNPFYYTANATSESHYESIVDYMHQLYPEDTIHIIHEGTSKERFVIERFKAYNTDTYKEDANHINEILMTKEDNAEYLKSDFDSLDNHVVLLPSSNETYTTYVLSQLAQINNYRPSVVFGMPTWKRFKNLNYDYLEWLQVHVSHSYWIDKFNMNVSNMTQDFTFKYGMEPSEFAYQGYDLAYLVIDFLAGQTIGNQNKEQCFTDDKPYEGVQTSFEFIPRLSPDGEEIMYWDNKHTHILKFENYSFNKVN